MGWNGRITHARCRKLIVGTRIIFLALGETYRCSVGVLRALQSGGGTQPFVVLWRKEFRHTSLASLNIELSRGLEAMCFKRQCLLLLSVSTQ